MSQIYRKTVFSVDGRQGISHLDHVEGNNSKPKQNMSKTITNDSTYSNAVNAIALSVGFGGFVTDEDANLIAQFGASKDAAVVFGQNCEFALQERHYGFNGSKIIRYRPDPRDFHSAQDWVCLIKDGTATVC